MIKFTLVEEGKVLSTAKTKAHRPAFLGQFYPSRILATYLLTIHLISFYHLLGLANGYCHQHFACSPSELLVLPILSAFISLRLQDQLTYINHDFNQYVISYISHLLLPSQVQTKPFGRIMFCRFFVSLGSSQHENKSSLYGI